MKKISLYIFLALIFIVAMVIAATPRYGVTNFESVWLNDSGGTAQPVLRVNQRGSGKIVEFQDGGTPVFSVNNGGGVVMTGSLAPSGATTLSGLVTYAQQSVTVTATYIITPTSPYVVITSNAEYTSNTTLPIATSGYTAGTIVIIRNGNASDPLNIDGTGGSVECKANVALGASDIIELIFNGTAWNCIAVRDNS